MIATEQNFDNFADVLARLDDFGLTPNQFRVYCHLSRMAEDGVVSESSQSIAKICKLTRITVIRVLSQLVQINLIECDSNPGKKSVFYLMPYSRWQMPAPEPEKQVDIQRSTQSLPPLHEGSSCDRKVVQFRNSNTTQPNSDSCQLNIQVNQITTQQEVQEPFKGSCTLQDGQPVNETNQSNFDLGSLDEKLAAARSRGWEAGTWWNDLKEQVVTVNRFVVTAAEFLQRSLDSFDVERQLCVEGLRMCRNLIEKIKQKKKQQLGDLCSSSDRH